MRGGEKSNATGACGPVRRFLAWAVMPSRVVVVADAHLGQGASPEAAAFHAFLAAVPDLGDALLINGDLFDFWFEYGAAIPRRHFQSVARLHDLRAPRYPDHIRGRQPRPLGRRLLYAGPGDRVPRRAG